MCAFLWYSFVVLSFLIVLVSFVFFFQFERERDLNMKWVAKKVVRNLGDLGVKEKYYKIYCIK